MKMRNLIVVCFVALFVLGLGGNVFATGGGNGGSGSGNIQGQTTDVSNDQFQINYGTGNSTGGNQSLNGGNQSLNLNSNYEAPRVGIVGAGLPYHLHVGPAPSQMAFWNTTGGFESLLAKKWTQKQIDKILDEPFCEWGFETESQIFIDSSKTTEIDLKSTIDQKDLAHYEFMGMINVRAKKDKTFLEGLSRALELAMKAGGEVALIDARFSKMNTIMHGSSVGPAGSAGNAAQSSFGFLSLGLNLSDTKGQAESVIIIAVLRKNGHTDLTKVDSAEASVLEDSAITVPVEVPKEETQETGAKAAVEESPAPVSGETQEVGLFDIHEAKYDEMLFLAGQWLFS